MSLRFFTARSSVGALLLLTYFSTSAEAVLGLNYNYNDHKYSGSHSDNLQDFVGSEKREVEAECTTIEEHPADTFVMNVVKRFNLYNQYSADMMSKLTFNFLTQPADKEKQCFTINNTTGDLRTAFRIDRDKICPRSESCPVVFDIAIQPTDAFQIVKVKVEILDINDNAPFFPQPIVHHQLPEFAEIGTGLVIPAASDPDSPKFGIQNYSLLETERHFYHKSIPNSASTDQQTRYRSQTYSRGGVKRKQEDGHQSPFDQEKKYFPSKKFQLKFKTTADGGTDVRLVLQEKLDRETEDRYMLTVFAIDGGDPPKTGSILVNITVQDANDNSPIFEQPSYETSLPENSAVRAFVVKVRARDDDIGDNGAITYEFSENTLQDYGHLFSIDTNSGRIILKNNLDYETRSVYQLQVIARDKGPDSLPGRASVTIKVTDVNDHSPQIQVKTLTSEVFAEVKENSEAGAFVAHLSVSDADSGENGKFECSVDNAHFRLSRIYEEELKVTTAMRLDREEQKEFDLSISCKDSGQQAQTTAVPLKVLVTDENDNDPVFDRQLYEATIRENSPPGTFLLKVTARDPDEDENARISYDISSEFKQLITVDEDSGVLTSAVTFDYEQIKELDFQLTASDHGNPPRSSHSRLKVFILDEEDSRPVFEQENYEFKIIEHVSPGTFVGEVRAYDGELKSNREDANFVYVIEPLGEGLPGSFYHQASSNLNYDVAVDPADVMSLRPHGRQLRSSKSNSTRSSDETSKQDTAPNKSGSTPLRSLRSSSFRSKILYTSNSVYQQTNIQTTSDVLDLFEIDSGTGRITTKLVLDREYQETYKFYVIAYAAPSFIPHSIHLPSRSESLHKRSRDHDDEEDNDDEVIDMRYYDPIRDDFERYNSLLHRQVTYNDFPRETPSQPSHTATVLVTIHVEDTNDNRPYFLFPGDGNETLIISSQTPNGHSVAKLRAVDPDSGQNAELTYHMQSFTPNNHAASKAVHKRRHNFRLSPTSGDLSVVGDLSDVVFETYVLEVVVKDSGLPQLIGQSKFLKLTISREVPFLGYSRYSYESAYGILASEDTVVVLAFTLALVLLAIIIIIGVICALKKRTTDGRNGGGNGAYMSNSPSGDGDVRRRLCQNAGKATVPSCGTECLIDSYSSSVIGAKPVVFTDGGKQHSGRKSDHEVTSRTSSCCCVQFMQKKPSPRETKENEYVEEGKIVPRGKVVRCAVEGDLNHEKTIIRKGAPLVNGSHVHSRTTPISLTSSSASQPTHHHLNNLATATSSGYSTTTGCAQGGKATAIVNAYVTPEERRQIDGGGFKSAEKITPRCQDNRSEESANGNFEKERANNENSQQKETGAAMMDSGISSRDRLSVTDAAPVKEELSFTNTLSPFFNPSSLKNQTFRFSKELPATGHDDPATIPALSGTGAIQNFKSDVTKRRESAGSIDCQQNTGNPFNQIQTLTGGLDWQRNQLGFDFLGSDDYGELRGLPRSWHPLENCRDTEEKTARGQNGLKTFLFTTGYGTLPNKMLSRENSRKSAVVSGGVVQLSNIREELGSSINSSNYIDYHLHHLPQRPDSVAKNFYNYNNDPAKVPFLYNSIVQHKLFDGNKAIHGSPGQRPPRNGLLVELPKMSKSQSISTLQSLVPASQIIPTLEPIIALLVSEPVAESRIDEFDCSGSDDYG